MKSPETRPWSLVTGASAGIGAAFARELAASGHALVLVARRRDRLEALAREILDAHGTRSLVVEADLARSEAPREIFEATTRAGVAVELLVNNAGYGVPGSLVSQPWERHRDFIQVLMTAACELCHLYLPAMRERGRGTIINVASLAGIMPGSAGHTLYGASKAFAIRFSQSLALENEAKGIRVCALCPGFTWSEFHDVTGARELVSKMPRWMWMGAGDVARQGLAAAARGRVVYVPGKVNAALAFMGKHLPDAFALPLMRRQSKRFRKSD